ncbi:class I SAM-dependent methyltransferase [Lapillicoccus sp.]|uniref:class I SAM-dependent methyltransferase n=1 Tax=Lapillicoccus sp. TaxID=1909287 RepID=UPI00344C4F42
MRPASQFDAVLSSTALHWLPAEALSGLYRDLAQLLRPGGVFLNADHLPYGPATPILAQLSEHPSTSSGAMSPSPLAAPRQQSNGGKASPTNPGWARSGQNGLDASTVNSAPTPPPSTTTSRRCEPPASARLARFGRPSRTEYSWPSCKTRVSHPSRPSHDIRRNRRVLVNPTCRHSARR